MISFEESIVQAINSIITKLSAIENTPIRHVVSLTAGENLSKGDVVYVSAPYTVSKILQNTPTHIGVVLSDVLSGALVTVILSGVAQISFTASTTAGHICRGFVAAEGGFVAGKAVSEGITSSTFKIGWIIETRVGAGLAKVII